MFTLVGILALSPTLSNQASATHLSDEFTWQLVVLSSTPACSNYHNQILNKYDEITEKEFIDGLQWLISNGVIQVTET